MPRTRKSLAPIDSPARRRLPLLLRRAWYGLNQTFRRRIAHLGLTPDQFTVMRTLLEQEAITQRQLTDFMASDPNTVAALLERMVRAGWIRRETHERDRRANQLRVTAEGKIRYAKARAIAVKLQTEVLGELSATECESFLAQLERIGDACRRTAGQS